MRQPGRGQRTGWQVPLHLNPGDGSFPVLACPRTLTSSLGASALPPKTGMKATGPSWYCGGHGTVGRGGPGTPQGLRFTGLEMSASALPDSALHTPPLRPTCSGPTGPLAGCWRPSPPSRGR